MASLQLIYHDHSACPKITHMRFTLTNVQTTSGDDEKGKKKFLLIACHQTLQPVKQWSSFSQDHQLWARAKSPLQYVNERTMSKNTHFITPGGTRTHNLWIRSPTPYPLGHRGSCFPHRSTQIRLQMLPSVKCVSKPNICRPSDARSYPPLLFFPFLVKMNFVGNERES